MPEDLFRLQQEALRRAREMHSRAAPLPRTQREPEHKEEPKPEPVRDSPASDTLSSPNQKQDLLGALFKDKDRTIILALMVLLSGEEENHTLLFALMYLLM